MGKKMVNNDNMTGPMLTTTEVARLLHIHNNTVRRWADKGIIKAYRISSRGDRRFKRDDIAQLLVVPVCEVYHMPELSEIGLFTPVKVPDVKSPPSIRFDVKSADAGRTVIKNPRNTTKIARVRTNRFIMTPSLL